MAAGAGGGFPFEEGTHPSFFPTPHPTPIHLSHLRSSVNEDFLRSNLEQLESTIALKRESINILSVSIGTVQIPARAHQDQDPFWQIPKRPRDADDEGFRVKWRFEYDELDAEGATLKKEIRLEGALQVLFFLKMLLNNQIHMKGISQATYVELGVRIHTLMRYFFNKMVLLENTPTKASELASGKPSTSSATPFNQGIFFISVGLLQWMLVNKQSYSACQALIMSFTLSVNLLERPGFQFRDTKWSALAAQHLILSPHLSISLKPGEPETSMSLIEFSAREKSWFFLGWIMEKIGPSVLGPDKYVFKVGPFSILGLFLADLTYDEALTAYETSEKGQYDRSALWAEIVKIFVCKLDFIYSKSIADRKSHNSFLIRDLIKFCFEAHAKGRIDQSCSQALVTDVKGSPEVSTANFRHFVDACLSEAKLLADEAGSFWCVDEFIKLRDIDITTVGRFIEENFPGLVEFIQPKTIREEIEQRGRLSQGLRGLQKAIGSCFSDAEPACGEADREGKRQSTPAKGSPSRRLVGSSPKTFPLRREEGSTERISFLERQLESTQAELSSVTRDREDHRLRTAELEKLLKSRETMIDGLKRQIEELAAKLTIAEQSAAAERKKQSARTGKPKLSINPLEHATLKTQLERTVQRVASFEMTLQAKDQEILRLTRNNLEKDAERRQLEHALEEASATLSQKDRELSEGVQKSLDQDLVIDALRKKLSLSQEKIRVVELEKSASEAALIERNTEVGLLKKERDSLRQDVSTLEKEIQLLNERVSAYKPQIQEIKTTLQEKESQRAQLVERKEALMRDVGLLREQVHAMTVAIRNPTLSQQLSTRMSSSDPGSMGLSLWGFPKPLCDGIRARGAGSGAGAGGRVSGTPDTGDSLSKDSPLDFSEF
jgi:hypothetical protein